MESKRVTTVLASAAVAASMLIMTPATSAQAETRTVNSGFFSRLTDCLNARAAEPTGSMKSVSKHCYLQQYNDGNGTPQKRYLYKIYYTTR